MKKITLKFILFLFALTLYSCSADTIEEPVQLETKNSTTDSVQSGKAATIYTGNVDTGGDIPMDK